MKHVIECGESSNKKLQINLKFGFYSRGITRDHVGRYSRRIHSWFLQELSQCFTQCLSFRLQKFT